MLTQSQLDQAEKCGKADYIPEQVWFIDPNQFDEPIKDPFINVEIHSECEARGEALRIAKLVGHRVIVETKTPENAWEGFVKDFVIYPWQEQIGVN